MTTSESVPLQPHDRVRRLAAKHREIVHSIDTRKRRDVGGYTLSDVSRMIVDDLDGLVAEMLPRADTAALMVFVPAKDELSQAAWELRIRAYDMRRFGRRNAMIHAMKHADRFDAVAGWLERLHAQL